MRRLRLIAVILLFFLSLSSIAIGFLGNKLPGLPSGLTISIASGFGAALLGASLSMIIEEMLGTEIRDIWQYLTVKEKFESAPDYFSAVTGKWHVYYQTKSDGERIWKYVNYSLIAGDTGKSLSGQMIVLDQQGKERTYRIEAGIRGDSLISIFKATSGHENDSIEIIPKLTHSHLPIHLGIQMLETWDGELAISMSLYSRDKLLDIPAGPVLDGAKLDSILKSSMKSQGIVDLNSFTEVKIAT